VKQLLGRGGNHARSFLKRKTRLQQVRHFAGGAGLLLQRLPVPAPEQVGAVVIQASGSPLGSLGFSCPQFVEFRHQMVPFCEVFGQ